MSFEIAVGDRLPTLTKSPDREALVKYAAGGGDFNPLHFDADFPQTKLTGGNIVHGRLKYAAMGQCVSDWLAHRGWIRSISAQYRGMDLVSTTFTCEGEVTDVREEDGSQVATVRLWTADANGNQTTVGQAEVVVPT
ncbi:MaoC/PaaZ C-terminal domain-containing protein [Cumulibacter manganitolerans]|uniref:MaoC/PaaZ C-terminal domain-containing protein n=1 Tax=Cumulibacter manganitolerans TaxID=1884992 RepID=UPI0012967DED|nr:MaoC/PaaZ C-terminal domain-containing protein [Cumulibacter manganitolerans]